MMSELDYEKIIGYAQQFNQWKQELFPREEYAYRNGCRFGAEAGKDTSVYGGSGYWLDKDPAMDLSRHAKMFVSRVDCNSTHFQPRNSALFMEAMKLRRNARFSENFSKGRDDARNS